MDTEKKESDQLIIKLPIMKKPLPNTYGPRIKPLNIKPIRSKPRGRG